MCANYWFFVKTCINFVKNQKVVQAIDIIVKLAIVELFEVEAPDISKYLKNIYRNEELTTESTVSKMEIVQNEGGRSVKRNMVFYNLDAIMADGYRVGSKKAMRFRQGARYDGSHIAKLFYNSPLNTL